MITIILGALIFIFDKLITPDSFWLQALCDIVLKGNEKLPILSHGSERNTGFTHGTKARPVFYSKLGQVFCCQMLHNYPLGLKWD